MSKRITERLASTAEAYEIYSADSRSLNVSFDNDRLNEIRQGESSGVGIRAVKQGRIGFSYSSKPGDVASVAESAVRLAPWGKPYDYEFAAKQAAKADAAFDPACGDLNVERLVALCESLKATIKEIDPDAMVDAAIGGGTAEARVATSRGQECGEQGSSFGYFVGARMSEEGNFVQVYRGRSSSTLIPESEMQESARDVGRLFKVARKVMPLKKGTYRVLFAPTAVCDLLMPISASVNGVNIQRKTSRFVESLGENLFDARLTLHDDPHFAGSPGHSLFDGEGIATQRRAIVEAGTLKGFIHTLSTAHRCAQQPTGNAQRAVSSQPSPGFHNLVMEPGSDELVQMYQQANGGVCVRNMLGTFTSNFLAGQVSGNVALGFRVEDGQPVGRIKNCAINVNGFDLLKSQIVAISREREWVGSQYLPWMLVDAVAISAR